MCAHVFMHMCVCSCVCACVCACSCACACVACVCARARSYVVCVYALGNAFQQGLAGGDGGGGNLDLTEEHL